MLRSALKSYHFDLGDSTRGPIGLCARVAARTKRDAVTILRDHLPERIEVRVEGTEYVEVYLNPRAIGTRDIDSADPIEPVTQ